MADSKEETKVPGDLNAEVKPKDEDSTNSEEQDKNQQQPQEGSDTDDDREAPTVPPKSSDESDGQAIQKAKECLEQAEKDEEKVENEKGTSNESSSINNNEPITAENTATMKAAVDQPTPEANANAQVEPKSPTPTVVMREKKAPETNGNDEKDPRVSMDDCIEEVKKTGRASLQMLEDPFEGVNFTNQKSPQLKTVLEKLSYVEGRVGQDEDKYIVPRDGITSFVFLAKK